MSGLTVDAVLLEAGRQQAALYRGIALVRCIRDSAGYVKGADHIVDALGVAERQLAEVADALDCVSIGVKLEKRTEAQHDRA